MTRQRRLKDRLEAKIRAQDKSPNTAKSYWRWIEQFIRYHHIRHPLEMGEDEVRDFLSSWPSTGTTPIRTGTKTFCREKRRETGRTLSA